nr:MAG TPA: hypothetical protein [Caudoviricetes sp.]
MLTKIKIYGIIIIHFEMGCKNSLYFTLANSIFYTLVSI